MRYALNTYQLQSIGEEKISLLNAISTDLLFFCLLLFLPTKQRFFADESQISAPNETNLQDNLADVAAQPFQVTSYIRTFYDPELVLRIRQWIACIAGTGRSKKKFNEESDHNSLYRGSSSDCLARRWRARSIIYPIRREPAYCW